MKNSFKDHIHSGYDTEVFSPHQSAEVVSAVPLSLHLFLGGAPGGYTGSTYKPSSVEKGVQEAPLQSSLHFSCLHYGGKRRIFKCFRCPVQGPRQMAEAIGDRAW